MPNQPQPPQDLPARVTAGLAKIALVSRHEAWQAAGEHGLSPTQAQIIAVIGRADDHPGVGTIAQELALTIGTVSAAISTLVEKGFVIKRKSPDDARSVTLRLTARGKRHLRSAEAWPDGIRDAIAALPETEQAALVRGLVSLVRELQERGSVPTARMCAECRYFQPHRYPGEAKVHYCAYIDAPIGDVDLRFDCREMEPVAPEHRARLWNLFVEGRPIA